MRSAVARLLSFVPTAVATLATSKLILSRFGVESFDNFAIVLTLINLVPLNNLGVGAAVTSVYASHGPDSEYARRVTLTSARTLLVSSFGTAGVAAVLTAMGAWPRLLGVAAGPNLYCGLAMMLYALSFLPGLAQSMLLGTHRNHVTVIVQTFFTPLVLLGVVLIVAAGWKSDAVMLVAPGAIIVINLAMCVLAGRTSGISWAWVLRSIPRRRLRPGAPIRYLSGPFLIITLTGPLALQSDRIILSHVSTVHAVANYSVTIQIFAPVIALVAASAQPLWPIYTSARSRGEREPSVGPLMLMFGAAFGVVCLILVPVAGPIGHLIGGHAIELGWLLPIAAGLTVLGQAATYPLGMSLMDGAGVRVLSICALIALPLNILLSIFLADKMGASGPLFATAAVGFVVQVIPPLIYSNDRKNAGRHRAPSRPVRPEIPGPALPLDRPVAPPGLD